MDPMQGRTARTVAGRLVDSALAQTGQALGAAPMERAQACLLDYLSCAFEALPLPWSEQAARLAVPLPAGGACIVGRAGGYVPADAAFANAVAGHGLVREDMHAGSVAHLGVIVWPTLLALAQQRPVSGRDLLVAAIVGYETGAQIGRAVMTEALGRLFRPTGLVGPFAAVAAGARLAGLDGEQALNAFALAGNCCGGLNEWPHTGASEMYFHPGFAVRNAMACLALARQGATGSASILEGQAGFFAAYARAPLAVELALFARGQPEIMAVFNKAVPACNFAQSPCQAALALAARLQGRQVAAVRIETTRAALAYPGCSATGPFERALQAKMSIPFGVAATLARGQVAEANYADLHDPEVCRLLAATTLAEDPAYTAAFPARQGARVTVRLADGQVLSEALDDVRAADDALIRARFLAAAAPVLGQAGAQRIAGFVDQLQHAPDAGELARLCAVPAAPEEHSLGRTPL
ncbi:MmgE/PrpD family protein [Orrella sp. JC864]|uniref:MmgE/PrpD family protein n=1 Tax=Orrella sp. JC864 TaxID=3120298 RepID=UPI003008EE64